MDQMLIWALLHDEMSRKNRKRNYPTAEDPFWGDGWVFCGRCGRAWTGGTRATGMCSGNRTDGDVTDGARHSTVA
jgi:hypothetical protein